MLKCDPRYPQTQLCATAINEDAILLPPTLPTCLHFVHFLFQERGGTCKKAATFFFDIKKQIHKAHYTQTKGGIANFYFLHFIVYIVYILKEFWEKVAENSSEMHYT